MKAWNRAEVAIARKREKQFEKNVAELQQFIEHFRQQQGKIKTIVKMSLDKHKPFYDSRLQFLFSPFLCSDFFFVIDITFKPYWCLFYCSKKWVYVAYKLYGIIRLLRAVSENQLSAPLYRGCTWSGQSKLAERHTVPGPNNVSRIMKKIRYLTPFLKNNEITDFQKPRYLSQNLTD